MAVHTISIVNLEPNPKKPPKHLVGPGHAETSAKAHDEIEWENKSGYTAIVHVTPHSFIVHPHTKVPPIPHGGKSAQYRVGTRPQDQGYHHYGVLLKDVPVFDEDGKLKKDEAGNPEVRDVWVPGEDSEPAVIVGP